MCIAARRGNDRPISAVSVSGLLAVLYPAEGNLTPGNLKIAQHLIKGRAGRGLIGVRFPSNGIALLPSETACSCASLSFAALATLISWVGSRALSPPQLHAAARHDCRRPLPRDVAKQGRPHRSCLFAPRARVRPVSAYFSPSHSKIGRSLARLWWRFRAGEGLIRLVLSLGRLRRIDFVL